MFSSRFTFLSIIFSITILAASELDTNKVYNVQEIEVIGNYQNNSTTKINTVSPKLIQSTASTNLKEILRFSSGVRVENNCQNCGFTQVRINGMEGKYSQILIDGRPVFSGLNSVYGLEQIPTDLIERIEIIKGSPNAALGSGAIAGSINVITKQSEIDKLNIKFNNTQYSLNAAERIVNANYNYNTDNYKLSILSNFTNKDEFDFNKDGFTEIPRGRVFNFGIINKFLLSDESLVDVKFMTIQDTRRGGNNLHLKPEETEITEQIGHNTNFINANYFLLYKDFDLNIYTNTQYTQRNSYYGTNKDPNAYGVTFNFLTVNGLNLKNKLFESGRNSFGIESYIENLNDIADGYNYQLQQNVRAYSIYNDFEYNFNNDLTANLGLRFEKHNLLDKLVLLPKFNLKYKYDNTVFRMTYSNGYRAPQAFNEDLHIAFLGGQRARVVINSNLKEETSESINFSVDYNFGDLTLPKLFTIDMFYTKLRNAYNYRFVGEINNQEIIEKYNADDAYVFGANFELKLFINSELELSSGLTIQKAQFSSRQEIADNLPQIIDFMRTPNSYGFLNLNYKINNNFTLNAGAVYTGSMSIAHFAGYIENDRIFNSERFIEINANMIYSIDENIALQLVFNNITNSFQTNFDKGVNRDSKFVYGPLLPRTIGLSLKYRID
jgi:outer membrane receptor for ferrienterochelin and colicins